MFYYGNIEDKKLCWKQYAVCVQYFQENFFPSAFLSRTNFSVVACIGKMTEGRHSRRPVNLDVKVSPGKSSGQRSQVNF